MKKNLYLLAFLLVGAKAQANYMSINYPCVTVINDTESPLDISLDVTVLPSTLAFYSEGGRAPERVQKLKELEGKHLTSVVVEPGDVKSIETEGIDQSATVTLTASIGKKSVSHTLSSYSCETFAVHSTSKGILYMMEVRHQKSD